MGSLDRIKAPSSVDEKPDDKSQLEEQSYKGAAKEEHLKLKLENARVEQENTDRPQWAYRFFILACIWLLAIFAVLFLQGFNIYEFTLSDKVIITLISGTTLNVLGILAVVAKYYFKSH